MTAPNVPTIPVDNIPIEPPPEDINSIGARERTFPVVLFIVGGLVLLLLIAGTAYWVKEARPFSTSKKEDYPVQAVPEPSATAPKIEIAEASAPIVPIPLAITPGPSVPAPTAGKAPGSVGNGPCPVTAVIDKTTQRPVTDARGVPVTVDCKGIYSTAKGAPGLQKQGDANYSEAESLPLDRYQGEALLSRQQGSKQSLPAAAIPTQLPSPPVGANEVLKQLQALQSGQAATATRPVTNPLPVQPRSNGVPNTQGNPRDMLTTEKTERTFAVKAIDESLVIPKGTQIDCGLTTRAITEISGFASCQVTRDVYSANGRVLLIERMSVVDGEYAAQSQAGQRYIHVLWTRVRKPGGTTIDIASPATDGLGGAGIPAIVDNRWMERIGGAYLLSFIKDAIAYKTATDSSTGDSVAASVAYQNTISTSQSMAEKVLSNTIGIKPLLYANQGDRVAIYVARDVDFSQIYAIRNK